MAGMVSIWHSTYNTGFLHRLSASLWNRGGYDEAGNYSIPCRHDNIASSGAPQGDPLVDMISGLRFTSCPQGKENKERHATSTSCSGGLSLTMPSTAPGRRVPTGFWASATSGKKLCSDSRLLGGWLTSVEVMAAMGDPGVLAVNLAGPSSSQA